MVKITPIYTAEVTNTGGRRGHVRSSEGILDADVSMPAELGGDGKKLNPEILFAAGYSSCFGGAIGAIANGRNVADAIIKARVSFGKTEQGGFGISSELHVTLPNLSKEEAQKVVEEAHQVCPYSVATRGNMEVTFFVNQ